MAEKTINYIKLPDGETYKIGGSGSGFNLFDTKVSDHVLEGEEALGWALQGTYVYKEAVAGSRYGYPDFYAKCLEEYENATSTETVNSVAVKVYSNGHKFYDIANKSAIDTFYNTYGIADFYGVDTENERIFLPRNDYFVQLTTDTSKVNDYIEAGLPNITGTVKSGGRDGEWISGAFSHINSDTNGVSGRHDGGSDSNYSSGTAKLDASRSSSVYGKSSTVQPPSSLKLLYYCVGNTKVESAVLNVTEITTSENDTLPLFHNFYSKEDMTTTGAYVNASLGSYLSGNVYTTAYNKLVNKLGTDNVKANTDTYTDYDFVVNQDDMTFRLPLLNGSEDLPDYSNGQTIDSGFVAPCNGILWFTNSAVTNKQAIVYVNNIAVSLVQGGSAVQDPTSIHIEVKVNDVITFTNPASSQYIKFFAYQGNGNLYYKLSNAVTNLEILDAGKVMNAVNTVVPDNASLISSYGMPSTNSINLTLGATGAQYTAPANGWVIVELHGSKLAELSINAYCGSSYISYTTFNPLDTNFPLRVSAPVTKGSKFQVWYTNLVTKNRFQFIYAQGEV